MNQSAHNPYHFLKLAKQGDPQALQAVFNHLFSQQNITAKIALKNDYLHITLQSAQAISQTQATQNILKILQKINAPYIKTAVIQAKCFGDIHPTWTNSIDLTQQSEIKPAQKKQAIRLIWPAWFPYPSSWLRALILLLWVAIIVRIFGFWGFFFGRIIAIIADDLILFLKISGVSLMISSLLLSYVYHLIHFKPLPDYPRWFPTPDKLWEGVYAPIVLLVSLWVVTFLCLPFFPLNECTLSEAIDSAYCQRLIGSYLEQLNTYATVIWLVSIVYLYQLEYLLKTHFQFKLFSKLMAASLVASILMFNARHSLKYWQSFYNIVTEWTQTPTTVDEIQASVKPTINAPEINTPNIETQSEAFEESEINYFEVGVREATLAAELTQLAQSQLEWNKVAQHWENALNAMAAVSVKDSHYQLAQDRVIQYQKNLDYARLAASRTSS